ncbi:hypothetical protein BSFP_017450 [Burkholderia stabilis]|uniref:Uncharacterized protein n=1 Tax=Burkholderia stabilis TaxID=95485 RepID=A0A1Y1BIH9_9BURK|nr:hypothetical protein BSFP_017450 [Burkholderia stabilis]
MLHTKFAQTRKEKQSDKFEILINKARLGMFTQERMALLKC